MEIYHYFIGTKLSTFSENVNKLGNFEEDNVFTMFGSRLQSGPFILKCWMRVDAHEFVWLRMASARFLLLGCCSMFEPSSVVRALPLPFFFHFTSQISKKKLSKLSTINILHEETIKTLNYQNWQCLNYQRLSTFCKKKTIKTLNILHEKKTVNILYEWKLSKLSTFYMKGKLSTTCTKENYQNSQHSIWKENCQHFVWRQHFTREKTIENFVILQLFAWFVSQELTFCQPRDLGSFDMPCPPTLRLNGSDQLPTHTIFELFDSILEKLCGFHATSDNCVSAHSVCVSAVQSWLRSSCAHLRKNWHWFDVRTCTSKYWSSSRAVANSHQWQGRPQRHQRPN